MSRLRSFCTTVQIQQLNRADDVPQDGAYKPDEFFVDPDGVVEIAWDLIRQFRRVWSLEVEARSFGGTW